MTTNAQTQSSEEKKTYTEMPTMEEFRDLDSETQKALIEQFPDSQDQEEEKSETSEEKSEEKSDDQSQEDGEAKTESEKSEKQEEAKKEEPDLVKNYKELQAEFTRRSQKMKQLEAKLSELEAKVKPSQDSEAKSPLDELIEKNPQAKDLIEAIRAEMESKLGKGLEKEINPIKEKLTQQTETENWSSFTKGWSEMMESPLKGLEQEFNAVATEKYGSQEAFIEQAHKNPLVFETLKKEVLSTHFIKAAKLMGEVISQEDKNKRVKDTGISGKAKTTTAVDDELDMKVFKSKTSDEMKKILAKNGAVKQE